MLGLAFCRDLLLWLLAVFGWKDIRVLMLLVGDSGSCVRKAIGGSLGIGGACDLTEEVYDRAIDRVGLGGVEDRSSLEYVFLFGDGA